MKTQSAKAKGRRLQQSVRDTIIDAFGLTTDDVYSRAMGSGGVDVYLSPAAKKVFPFSTECKNQETFSVYKAWDQAVLNVLQDTFPLVVYKKNGRNPLAILDFYTFMALAKRAAGG